MLTLGYEENHFYDAATEAIEREEPFDVVIKGFRARIIRKARPLIGLLFDNPEQPIRSKRFTILRLFTTYLLLSPTFWGVRFLATRAGMNESWNVEDGVLTVSFRSSAGRTGS
mgnify:CR=1 FL=1